MSRSTAPLATPDRRRRQGERDYGLLLFLYNTGARADEAARTTRGVLDLGQPASLRIARKGGKTRLCPLWQHTATVLRALLGGRVDGPADAPVFVNMRGEPLTRFGVYALVIRPAAAAAEQLPSLLEKRVSPHTVRHTTPVHLLLAGVDINTIRAWLGHVSLEITNRYAEVDLKMKAKALATCTILDGPGDRSPKPARPRHDALDFLASL